MNAHGPVDPGATPSAVGQPPNGAALAAFVAAGIGSFAMGAIVLLGEAGLFSPPALYGPAGGVSGRTTLAVLVWLFWWGLLHRRWRRREVDPGRAFGVALALIALGLLSAFQPLWALL